MENKSFINAKRLNVIMMICVLVLSIFFGVTIAVRKAYLAELDRQHDLAQGLNRKEEEDKINGDIIISNKNDGNNNPITPPTTTTTIDFTNFSSMYTAAEKKLKNASYVWSNTTGTATISGKAKYGILTMNATNIETKLQAWRYASPASNNEYFWHNLQGEALGFKLFNDVSVYRDSSVYYHWYSYQDPYAQVVSKQRIDSLYHWTVYDTIHSVPPEAIKKVSNIVYDKINKTYTATAELNVASACTRASMMYQGLLGGTAPAKYSSCKITVTIKENGSFEKIRYQETFKINIYNAMNDLTLNGTVVADYTETFTSVDDITFSVIEPKWVTNVKNA